MKKTRGQARDNEMPGSGASATSDATSEALERREGDIADMLERERALHERTRAELNEAREEAERANRECEELASRFERALRGASIHAFAQDRDLRYTWIAGPRSDEAVQRMLGRTDDELWSSPEQQSVVELKRRVIETGCAEDCEVSFITPERRALFALHVEPVKATDGTTEGVLCTAVDISRIRSLESEQRRLTEDLATAAQRYEFALRGSNVAVFTQDIALRYTSVSKPIFGCEPETLHGKTDEEVLPATKASAIVALKREVLQKGEPRDAELSFQTANGTRWYDFHIEPMRDVSGSLIGLTGAAVDVTEQKAGEVHLRLLMRELTHRSKNLLAVIQAMARQTARHTDDIQTFLERFSARVQALARSHDLLVQESWHGVSLQELVQSQLAQYLDREPAQISIAGPDVRLKPEAAQSLGLALHELAANAGKHGALSRARGRVDISWQSLPAGRGIEFLWKESGGPSVEQPNRRGFGSMVIEQNLSRALDARVGLDFAADGLTCRVEIPMSQMQTMRGTGAPDER
ncbi:HWE histidine kinase domain-containing protein [Pseudorhodoplanes sp.]|uniref:HWE histidine kinase domain-containing protein n=1 Tax=Pseudorhodoplanes sp. TaxID=1934341 RepID=UPI00391B918A